MRAWGRSSVALYVEGEEGATEDRPHDRSPPQEEIRDDHPVIGRLRDDHAATQRLELAGRVDVVDSQDGEASVEGVSPAPAHLFKCIIEIGVELAVDDIGVGCVEIAAENCRCGGR